MLKHALALAFLLTALFGFALDGFAADAGKYRVYIGTYTGKNSKGIYRAEFDPATGKLSKPVLAGESVNPSFLAIHPTGKFLYAVNETGKGEVSSFEIDPKTGDLTFMNKQPTQGGAPCHIVVDKAGKHVLIANYSGGSVIVLPIEDDGCLGKATAFIQHKGSSIAPNQKGPHAHSINLDAANKFAFCADLGLDKVVVYKFDPKKGTLEANDPRGADVTPGSGPRHFDFHPTGKYAYVINENKCTVTAFAYDPKKGVLESIQTISTLPDDGKPKKGYSTAEVRVHPSGKFVYGSNRGQNSIVVFQVDAKTGKLTRVQNQDHMIKTPRNFVIDPTGKFLLAENQSGDSIVIFKIDGTTGKLEPTGQVIEGIGRPVCIRMMPIK